MKQKKWIPVFVLLSLMLIGRDGLYSQEVTLSTSFDTTIILTGDQIYFTVALEKPAGLIIELPQFRDTLVSGIEILKGPLTDSLIIANNRIIIRDRYLVTAFDSGRYELPPIYAEINMEEGIKRYYSDYNYLIVKRADITPADTTLKYFDIIGPYRVPLTAGEVIPWILAVLALATIVWFLLRFFRNRKKRESGVITDEPLEPAYIIAYRSLEKLKNEKLWQQALYKEYFSALSDILRTYIDRRYSMNSMESTTNEIITGLAKADNAQGEATERLKQVLELSDMVKFAKLKPDSSDCELSMEHSWSFISMTRKEKSVTTETVDSDKEEEDNKLVEA
jgi:hypothetical protein